jgi:ATP synthase protein I
MSLRNTKKPQFDSYVKYTGMAFQLFAGIFLGVWGGIKLDAILGTKPLFTVVLSLFGIAASMYSVLKDFIKPKGGNKKP